MYELIGCTNNLKLSVIYKKWICLQLYLHQTIMALPCTGVVLMETDFREVNRAVYKARAKWNPLGTELGVRRDVIKSLSNLAKPEENLQAILTAWLNDPDLKPCWGNLVKALRSITVDEKVLADEIIKEHLGLL